MKVYRFKERGDPEKEWQEVAQVTEEGEWTGDPDVILWVKTEMVRRKLDPAKASDLEQLPYIFYGSFFSCSLPEEDDKG